MPGPGIEYTKSSIIRIIVTTLKRSTILSTVYLSFKKYTHINKNLKNEIKKN